MVDDENNFDEARKALEEGLESGLLALYEDTRDTLLDNMEKGKDALGRDWQPVTEATLRSRKVRTSDPAALVDTGTSRADINNTSKPPQRTASGLVAVIGTTLDHLRHHEYGAPEAGIPRRPIFAPAAAYADQRAPELIGEEIDVRLEDAEVD